MVDPRGSDGQHAKAVSLIGARSSGALAGYLINAVVVEGRTVAELAASHGVSRSWLYELLARYRAGSRMTGSDSSRHIAMRLSGGVIAVASCEVRHWLACGKGPRPPSGNP